MRISKRCQYALKAVLELALRDTGQPVKIHVIAEAQHISPRFLEVILNQLKHGGFVESKRGNEGGYILARKAEDLTVGQIIKYVQGSISVIPGSATAANKPGEFYADAAFNQLWQQIDEAVSKICGNRTFAELVQIARAKRDASVPNYSI